MSRQWNAAAIRTAAFGSIAFGATACRVYAASEPPPQVVYAEPYDSTVYVAEDAQPETVIVERVGAEPTPAVPDRVAEEVLVDGNTVDVAVYVHTYPQPIETYPSVWWSGRWYYNVEGNFVFYDPFYGGWSFYWGPPVGLVSVWNYHYPQRRYFWGRGYYGAGYYYGGVSASGWHAYSRPPRYYQSGRVYRQPRYYDDGYRERRTPRLGERGGPVRRDRDDRRDRDYDRRDDRRDRDSDRRAERRDRGTDRRDERSGAATRRDAPPRAQRATPRDAQRETPTTRRAPNRGEPERRTPDASRPSERAPVMRSPAPSRTDRTPQTTRPRSTAPSGRARQPAPSRPPAATRPAPSRPPAATRPAPSRPPAATRPAPSRPPAAARPAPSRPPAATRPAPSRPPAAARPAPRPRAAPRGGAPRRGR